MRTRLILDTPILTMICHPKRYQEVRDWFHQLVSQMPPKHELFVSVVSLYEVRGGLSLHGALQSLEQFDKLIGLMNCLALDAKSANRAAMLRANNRNISTSVSDADLLIASQAAEVGATLVTSDKALVQLCNTLNIVAKNWTEIDGGEANAA